MVHDPFDFDRACDPPFEQVPVRPAGEHMLPEEYRDRILVYTVHDGGGIPPHFRKDPDGNPLIHPDVLRAHYVVERDWGANMVAKSLAAALGCTSFARCRVARVLMDFNRFPGTTPPSIQDPLELLAISEPMASALDHPQKMELLRDYYDEMSRLIDEYILQRSLISIAVHTYDEHNPSATRRPDMSIVSLPQNYQRESCMPYGVFDPMYPDGLAESTCSRVLRDRISLNLERSGFRVTHNHPYPLPEGSIEVRAQVWFYFRFLRREFEAAHPDTEDMMAYQWVWQMLLNTNLRTQEAEVLRGYIHRFRRVPPAEEANYAAAQRAYVHIRDFGIEHDMESKFRRSPTRPSSMGLEVRKDLLCDFDPENGYPMSPSDEQRDMARRVGQIIGEAVSTFFETDRPKS